MRSLKVWLWSCLFIVLISALGLAGENNGQPDRWTPELSMKYKSVRGTAISPDGQWVAYVVREPVMEGEKSEYRSQIWLASADGRVNVPYTWGEESAANPSFSPDGRYLAFTRTRDKKNQIWVMRVTGGEAEPVTKAESGVGAYRWAPDGETLAYLMRDPETEEEKKAEKEKRDVILVDRNFKYNHLYTVTLQKDETGKRKTKRLTAGAFHIGDFDWSPDGRTIVFAHQPDPRINTGMRERDISTVPADSGAVRPLVTRPGLDYGPKYSPDGRWVAFLSNGGTPQEIGLRDVFLVPAGGGTPKKLANTPDRNARSLTWARDGKRLLVAEAYHTTTQLFALPINGAAPVPLTAGNGVFDGFAFARHADRMAFTFQSLTEPVQVYTSSAKKFKMTRLTDLHRGVPRPPMGRTEVITWESRDGLEIEGLLTYPVNYEKGRRYPLVLNIHGGPAGVYTQSFTGNPSIYMIQTFAQNGYAVLRPNPRGSTGYGKDFRFANFKDWGHGDYEDLMAGVDKVIEMGVAHPDSLSVMGWSYGGYMTSYVVTRTNRFKAASMGAGLPNLISMVTTTDIPNYLVAHMGAEFWEDYETYEKHSAIYRIKNVSTPTQVIHGQRDLRVPFTQGQEFYVALSRLGVPTEMIVYPRTPHGPREPKFVMDVTPRILKWFDRHLGRSAADTKLTEKSP